MNGSLSQYKNDFLHSNHPIDLIDEKKFDYSRMSLNKRETVNNESNISYDNNFETQDFIVF